MNTVIRAPATRDIPTGRRVIFRTRGDAHGIARAAELLRSLIAGADESMA